jgi:erythromycin esterase
MVKMWVRSSSSKHIPPATLAMEASPSAARALDAYVRHGTGDPERLVARLGFWTWRIEWLRAHNRDLPEERRVRFVARTPSAAPIGPWEGRDGVRAVGSSSKAVAAFPSGDGGW